VFEFFGVDVGHPVECDVGLSRGRLRGAGIH
jgi:hypothetical protein